MPKIRSKKLLEAKKDLYNQVKQDYETGDYSMQELADKFNRSLSWINNVIHNKYLTK